MKTFMLAALSTLALTIGALSVSAGTALDKALGAGGFIHPTGPANGVWHSNHGSDQEKN